MNRVVLRRLGDAAVEAREEPADDEASGWDTLEPVTPAEPGLFPLDDPADRLDPLAEHGRQQAALAASAERGRLELLLAAESSGALVAAEMTHAGLPWRADVHEQLLTELRFPLDFPLDVAVVRSWADAQ